MIRKVIAGVLSAVLCSTALLSEAPRSRTDTTEPAQTAEQQPAGSGLEGQNSLGRYLAAQQEAARTPAAAPLRAAAAAEPVYAVTNLEFDRETGLVRVISSQTYDQKIVVQFIDEDNPSNVYRLEADVKAGEYVRTEFQADLTRLPAYFTVTAQLENVIGQAICQPFLVETYTHGMQDILEKEISDFEQEQVVNLDEDDKTNFFVLSEDTVQAETTETSNTLVSADYDQEIYVFENADETLLSLEKGQYFYIQPNETDIIAICVQDVTADGSTVTLTGDRSADIGEMFEFIKIEATGTGAEFMESDDPEQAEQAYESARRYLAANDGFEEPSAWENVVGVFNEVVQRQAESKEVTSILPKKGEGTLKEEATMDFGVLGEYQLVFGFELPYDYEFNFYRDHINVYTLFKIHCTISPSFKMKYMKNAVEDDKNPQSYELDPDHPVSSLMKKLKTKKNEDENNEALIRITVPTPIAGLDILFELDVQVTVSGQIEFGWSKEMTLGQAFLEGICFPIGDVKPLKWTKTNVQGEVEVKLEFDIGVVFAKLVDLKFRGSITLDILAEVSLMNKKHCMYGTPAAKSTMFMPFYETDEPSVHACDMGLDLKVDLTFKVGLVVSFGFKLPEKLETAALKNGLVKLFNLFGELKFEKELTLFDTTYHIGDYHVMSNKGGKYAGLNFVEQPCPNVAYRTTFNVQFTNITSASKAAIEVDGDMYEVPITPNTQLIFYATPGKHRYYLMVDSRQRAGAFFTVQNEPVTINIPITDSIDKNGEKHPEPSNPTILTGPAVPAVTTTATTPVTFQTATAPAVHPGYINTELIQFGDSIFGTLSHNGVLSISGCGDMFDHFTSSPVRNVKDVRLILLMDSDEEHGYVINTIGAHVFDGMENVEIVYLPQHITAIGDGAFRNCASLKYLRYGGEHDTSTTFILPTNLTKIGSEAFSGCKSAVFRELTFRPCIRTIGANAFGKCEGITELTVPGDSSPTIGRIAFSDCVNLRKAVIGDGTAGIGTELFSGCSGIEDLTMPYCGTSLTDTSKQLYEFFIYCNAPAGFYNVYHRQTPASSFYGCVPLSLTKFTVTGGTAVPGGFFENMKELKSVTLAESITEIGERAFRLCEQLETVNLPEKLTAIRQDAFYGCKAAAFGDLHLPDTLHEIGAAAFGHCEGITGLTVSGDGALTIRNSAFGSCVNLRKAVLGEGIETIAAHVFGGDANMEELTISRYQVKGNSETPVGISSYFNAGAQEGMYEVYCRYTPANSFRGYVPEKLKKVTVTDAGGVPSGFFANMKALESITLPAASPTVAAYAFNGCEALAEANLTGEGSWDKVDITETGNEPLLRVISQMRPVDYLLSNPLNPGDYFFRSKANNRYLDLAASSYTTLICYDFNAGRNQTFYYQDGEMKSEQNGKYVTMGESYYGGFKAVADEDSSVVEVYKKPGTENYYFTKSICDGNGDFKTYALEVKNPSASSSVVFWNELQVNNVNQQWSVESTSHEYGNSDVINIQNANSGLLLDMYTANGNLLQYTANGGDNQKWQVIPADNGRALLKTMCAAHPGYIGIGDDDRAVVGENEVPVKLFDNQDGTFRIYLPGTNKFLHVANDSMGNAIVKWEPYTGTGGFHWKYL